MPRHDWTMEAGVEAGIPGCSMTPLVSAAACDEEGDEGQRGRGGKQPNCQQPFLDHMQRIMGEEGDARANALPTTTTRFLIFVLRRLHGKRQADCSSQPLLRKPDSLPLMPRLQPPACMSAHHETTCARDVSVTLSLATHSLSLSLLFSLSFPITCDHSFHSLTLIMMQSLSISLPLRRS